MQRRSFLKASGALALGAGIGPTALVAKIPPHNFDKYDFGGGPPVPDLPRVIPRKPAPAGAGFRMFRPAIPGRRSRPTA